MGGISPSLLHLSLFQILSPSQISGHMGIVHMMCFDESFACPPNGRLIVDCVNS
jgi:hypothetical protein